MISWKDSYWIRKQPKITDFKFDDVVRIIGKAKDYDNWDTCWNKRMDRTIGKIGVIKGFQSGNLIHVHFGDCGGEDSWWWYPPWVLEKIE